MEGKPKGLAGILVWSFGPVSLVFQARLHFFFDFRDASVFLNLETGSFF